MKFAVTLGVLITALLACGRTSKISELASSRNQVDVYGCYLEGANKAFLWLRETDKVAYTRPNGAQVKVVMFEMDGRSIKGAGQVNADGIDVATLDALQGQILVKAKMEDGLMKGSVNMLGDIKGVQCYLLHQGSSIPEVK